MKTLLAPIAIDRGAKVDARCSKELKDRLKRIAAIRDIELSDVVREALREKAARFEQQAAGLSAA